MQDIHAFGGGRIFNAGGGGDRRLRPHNQIHQALKCPRCDSLNTKFCYYNNYNLSQPRHFCKNCRRYWTKGGVLRNVPVGGGCRKAKRAKSKHSLESSAAATAAQTQQQEVRDHSNSSSESSSTLTAANSNVAAASASASSSAGGSGEAASLLKVNESKLLESGLLEQGSATGIFAEVGNFTSLINSSSNETMPYGFSSMLNQEGVEQWQGATQQTVISGGLMDPTVHDELSGLRSRSGGLGALDWQGGGGTADQSLFDLPNTLDQTYWNQTQWSDQDHPGLYLP